MKSKIYTPSAVILKKYADVLIKFALGSGRGIKKGETVMITAPEAAKPLIFFLRQSILEAGGHIILNYQPDDSEEYNFSKSFYEQAKDHHLDFFPDTYMRGLVDQIDHSVFIIADTHPHALEGVDPKKIMRRGEALKPYKDWRQAKENAGKFTWVIGLYGTQAKAEDAKMSLEAYWKEIITACYLDEAKPIQKWRDTYKKIDAYIKKLNILSPKIEKLHVEGVDADLWITLGEKRQWLGGGGRNIPSYEIFTSPDWRGTNGWIRFNEPLYRYGSRVEGIELWFEDGKVVKSKAKKGEKLLQEMIKTKNADKIGEFSLTDKRFSRINKFMGETLFDENMGGPQGNTHLALGSAYPDTFMGDPAKLGVKEKERLGFNDSSVHTDIISTTKRRVTAHLKGGETKVIYDNGEFRL